MIPARKAVPEPEEQTLVRELAEQALARAAPEELDLFEETAQEFFDDPERVLRARARDEAVGFGLDAAMLTPYVLAVAGSVVSFLLSAVADSLKEEMRPRVAAFVRALFRRGTQPAGASRPAGTPQAAPLTPAQARQVRDVAYRRAVGLGLAEPTAGLLADSVVGGLLVSG